MILDSTLITGHYNAVYIAECSINYSLRMARAVFSGHARSIEVLPRAQRKYNTWIRKELGKGLLSKANGGAFLPFYPLSRLLLLLCINLNFICFTFRGEDYGDGHGCLVS